MAAGETTERRGRAILVLAALVSLALAALQAVGGPGISAQPAFATATGTAGPRRSRSSRTRETASL